MPIKKERIISDQPGWDLTMRLEERDDFVSSKIHFTAHKPESADTYLGYINPDRDFEDAPLAGSTVRGRIAGGESSTFVVLAVGIRLAFKRDAFVTAMLGLFD